MIKENKVSKYILYAIGEILLVIVGILIALQINNWNQQNNSLELEFEYLHSMRLELSADSLSIANLTNGLVKTIEGLDILITNNHNRQELPIDSITKLYIPIFFVPDFRGNTETFESIESSGHLSVIRNSDIKHDYFRLLKQYESYYKYYDQVFLSFAIDINKESTKYFALDKMKFRDELHVHSQEAMNTIMTSKFIRSAILSFASESISTINGLINKIDSELELRIKNKTTKG